MAGLALVLILRALQRAAFGAWKEQC